MQRKDFSLWNSNSSTRQCHDPSAPPFSVKTVFYELDYLELKLEIDVRQMNYEQLVSLVRQQRLKKLEAFLNEFVINDEIAFNSLITTFEEWKHTCIIP